jgi:hypothetical protein
VQRRKLAALAATAALAAAVAVAVSAGAALGPLFPAVVAVRHPPEETALAVGARDGRGRVARQERGRLF